MVSENIQGLLILQDRYLAVRQLKVEIARLPKEIETLEQKIADEKGAVEAAKREIQELELKRKELELEVESAEEQIGKYKNQQLLVKKNEEYKALTHEIELMNSKISDLETEELEVMESIDGANGKLAEVEADTSKKVKYQESLIAECLEKLENLKGQLGDAEAAYATQVEQMDAKEVSLFKILIDQIKRPPYVVELSAQNCGGCHMRVSNDVLKQGKIGELARCDQCARVVYVDR